MFNGKRRAEFQSLPFSKRLRLSSNNYTAESHSQSPVPSPPSISNGSSPSPPSPQSPITPGAAIPHFPSDLKTHQCTVPGCSKAFNRPARLAEHLRSHANERSFGCKEEGCDKTFLRANHLQHHVKSAHSSEREHTCDKHGCGKSFVTATRLRRHEAAHEGREKYQCVGYAPCNQVFRKHGTLQAHIAAVHLQQSPFPCTEAGCSQGFATAQRLRKHTIRMHPSAPRFLCLICPAIAPYGDGSLSLGLGFQTHYELHSHQAEVHPPTCIHCDKVFPSTRPLLQHLEVRHGVEADLPQSLESVHLCEEEDCGKTFSKKSNLTVHIRSVHQGEKPFECGVVSLDNIEGWTEGLGCGAKFKAKASLEQHIRTAHLGKKSKATERRVKKGVGRKSQRRQQSAISALTGVSYGVDTGRTIACLEETCEFRFMRLYDLRVHLVSRHGLSEADVDGLLQEKNESSQGQMVQPGGLMVEDDDPFLEAERQASLGGAFWLGGIEPEEIANDEDYHLFGELTQTLQEENDRMGDEAVDPRLR